LKKNINIIKHQKTPTNKMVEESWRKRMQDKKNNNFYMEEIIKYIIT